MFGKSGEPNGTGTVRASKADAVCGQRVVEPGDRRGKHADFCGASNDASEQDFAERGAFGSLAQQPWPQPGQPGSLRGEPPGCGIGGRREHLGRINPQQPQSARRRAPEALQQTRVALSKDDRRALRQHIAKTGPGFLQSVFISDAQADHRSVSFDLVWRRDAPAMPAHPKSGRIARAPDRLDGSLRGPKTEPPFFEAWPGGPDSLRRGREDAGRRGLRDRGK